MSVTDVDGSHVSISFESASKLGLENAKFETSSLTVLPFYDVALGAVLICQVLPHSAGQLTDGDVVRWRKQ